MKNIKEFTKIIKRTSKNTLIGILGHKNADHDSIFSCFAFACALKQMGFLNIRIFLDDKDSYLLNYVRNFTNTEIITNDITLKPELVIAIDFSGTDRAGVFEEILNNAKTLLVCDHHINSNLKADASVVISPSTSASEVAFLIFEKLKIKITKEIAFLLYVSIIADSQNFKFGASKRSFEIAAKLVATGIDLEVASKTAELKPTENELKAIFKAYEERQSCGSVMIYTINENDKLNIAYDQIKSKATYYLQTLVNDDVILVLTLRKNQIDGSFRSNCEKDVRLLAEKLGGGGHTKAAGFTNTTMSLSKILKIVKEHY